MKTGETRYLVKKLDLTKPYDAVRFRLSNTKNIITKSTNAEDDKDKVLESEGVFFIPLQQSDTAQLEGSVTIEAEIDFEDKSVRYTDFDDAYINKSLGWDEIENSTPSDDDGLEIVMKAIEDGVAILIEPQGAQDLIDAVTELYQQTKQIAQSVRDDADNGEFDGYSPQVTVKTETPSTYVLHIKDADHEYDTPNLQGQGGEGSIEAGDGLQRVGNVISVKRKQDGYILVTEDGLYIDVSGIAYNELLRGNLTIGEGALASKDYADTLAQALGNALSISIDSQTYVMTMQLKHNNQVLSTGTVDLPLETMVVDADYDSQTKEIVLTLQSGSTVRFSVADLVSGLVTESDFWEQVDALWLTVRDMSENKQDIINAQNKLDADLVDDSTSTNKFVSANEKQGWNAKADNTTISTDTTSTTVSLTLADNHEYRYTQELTSLTLTMPNGDFIASIVFASGPTPTSMTYDSSIKWSGDDVSSNAFVPQANMEYEIVFWYNGLSVNAVVRGVA